MKLSKTLPQFAKDTALFIVAGAREADFYLAHDGDLKKAASFMVPKAHYSDREDFGRKGSVVFESGDKASQRKKITRREFMQGVKDNLQLIMKGQTGITAVYLLVPAEVKKDMATVLPAKLKPKLKKIISGNFHKQHPFEWVGKIEVSV